MKSHSIIPYRGWSWSWIFVLGFLVSHVQSQSIDPAPYHSGDSLRWQSRFFGWDTLAVQNLENLWESALWPTLLNNNSSFHSSIKPWNALDLPQTLKGYRVLDTGYAFGQWSIPGQRNRSMWGYVSNRKDVGLRLDPLLSLGIGAETESPVITRQNMRGIRLVGFMGQRLRFQSSIGLHNNLYPLYLHQLIRQDTIVPGMGLARTLGQDSTGRVWDFYSSQAMLSWQIHPHLQAQWGHGKNFIGYGYRSMLLSDFAPAYTHLRLQAHWGPLQYQYYLAQMHDYSSPRVLPLGQRIWGSEGYRHKYYSMSYLDWNLSPGWQLGLFQAIVWPAQDTLGRRAPGWNYLNPLLFMIPAQFASGSDGNALVGINTGYRWGRQQAYAQWVLDELRVGDLLRGTPSWANKYAFQAGIRGWTRVSGQGFRWQVEINGARPFTYAHWSGSTNYAHQNSALAHPLGGNFVEGVGALTWFRGPWSITLRHLIAKQGRSDSTGRNTGSNIHSSYWAETDPSGRYTWLNGVPIRLNQGELRISKTLDPLTGLRLELTSWWRHRESTNTWGQSRYGQQSLGIGITFVTRIENFYHDF
jgi:hypothetical protein